MNFYSLRNTIQKALKKAADLAAENPFVAVTILSPSREISQSVNRMIAESGSSFLNLRTETVEQYIHRASENPRLAAGLRLQSWEDCRRSCEEILLSETWNIFAPAPEFPSYSHYFNLLLREISLQLSPPEKFLRSLPEESKPLADELLRFWNRYRKDSTGGLDYAGLCDLVNNPGEHLLLLPGTVDELLPREKEALQRSASVTEIPREKRSGKLPGFTLSIPPFTELEARDALRIIIDRKLPLDDCVLIVPEGNLENAGELCDRLNIPWRTPGGSPRLSTASRQFLAVLEIIRSDFRFPAIRDYLLLSRRFREIRVLGGLDVYSDPEIMLRALLKNRAVEEPPASNEPPPGELFAALATDPETKEDRLEKFLRDLIRLRELIEKPGECADFLCTAFLPAGRDRQVILRIVRTEQSQLPAEFSRWSGRLAYRVSRLYAEEKKPGGSLLITTESMPGIFSHVFFTGLSSENFPYQHREHPVLDDRLREILNRSGCFFLTVREKNEKEDRFLEHTLACTESDLHASYPWRNALDGSRKFPSHALLSLQSSLASGAFNLRDWQNFLQSSVRDAFPGPSENCLDELDFAGRELFRPDPGKFIAHALAVDENTAAFLRSYADFFSGEHGVYSGAAGAPPDQSERTRSVTGDFEAFFGCPYRWFLARLLGLKPLPEPEPAERMNALTIGNLVHEILEEALRTEKEPNKLAKKCRSLLEKKTAAFAAEHPSLPAVVLSRQSDEMGRMIDVFMSHYSMTLAAGRKVEYLEESFGYAGKEPRRFELGGRSFFLRGRIDRIDRGKDSWHVIDYKTGNPDSLHAEEFRGGRRLQPAIYAEALRSGAITGAAIPAEEKIFSGYLALAANGSESLPLHDEVRRQNLERILDFFFRSSDAGFFPQTGECTFCDFTSVCGKQVEISVRAKLGEPAATGLAAEFLNIREIP